MKIKSLTLLIACALLAIPRESHSAGQTAAPVKTVQIVASDAMRFDVTRIDATAGEKIQVQLRNGGTLPKEVMGHNWVLLTADADADAYATAAMAAKTDNFMPVALTAKVIAAIPLLGPGQTGEITFTAPAVAGKYIFMCTFPGHFSAGMRGLLIVR